MDIWPKLQLLNDSVEAFYVAFVEACNAFNCTYIDTRHAQRQRRRYFQQISDDDEFRVVKDRSTPENREFWDDAKRASDKVEKWPAWKRGTTHDVFSPEDEHPASWT